VILSLAVSRWPGLEKRMVSDRYDDKGGQTTFL
jgi:hypothetical protein